VENVVSHSMISGGMVTEKNCDNLVVRNFESFGNYYDGFAGYETRDSRFYYLNLHDNNAAGISIDINFNYNQIHDSIISNNKNVGIFARFLTGNQFYRLRIMNSGDHGVFLAKSDGYETCPIDNLFDTVIVSGSKGSAFRLNDLCKGNYVTGKSILCNNRDRGISESHPGTLIATSSVECRN
jgi:hypothetical protein